MKSLGIMQPYFLPYIGYFQLINAVDEYVLYDNIQFTKKGWIHRNRMLQNGQPAYFSLPIKKDSDYLDIVLRNLSDESAKEKGKILRKIEANYRKAPFFEEFFPVVKQILDHDDKNLFNFIYHSIKVVNEYLEIDTPIVISSTLPDTIKELKSQDKVLAICKERNADVYINSSGGMELYDVNVFDQQNVALRFYRTKDIQYGQFKNDFVPYLSILDVCMFNPKGRVIEMLNEYEFVS